MELPNKLVESNLSFPHAPNNEGNWHWVLSPVAMCLILWVVSRQLILASFLKPHLTSPDIVIAMVGTPLGILGFVILFVFFVFTVARLTLREIQRQQNVSLQGKSISEYVGLGKLVWNNLYHTRHWLIVIIGGGPYFLWLICQGYSMWVLQGNLRCFTSPLGHLYCRSDGAPIEMKQLEALWFTLITIGILGLIVFAIQCCVSFTMKSKKAVLSGVVVSGLMLPIVLSLILVTAPEGYLVADTAYGGVAMSEIYARMFPVGVGLAVVPLIASFGAHYFLKSWAYRESIN